MTKPYQIPLGYGPKETMFLGLARMCCQRMAQCRMMGFEASCRTSGKPPVIAPVFAWFDPPSQADHPSGMVVCVSMLQHSGMDEPALWETLQSCPASHLQQNEKAYRLEIAALLAHRRGEAGGQVSFVRNAQSLVTLSGNETIAQRAEPYEPMKVLPNAVIAIPQPAFVSRTRLLKPPSCPARG